VESLAGLPAYVGSAPIHMSADLLPKLNEPVIVANLAEATSKFGFFDAEGSAGAKKFAFTLCEAMSAHFKIGNVGPIVLINALDPAKHKTAVAAEAKTLGTDGTATLTHAHPWPASVVVKVASVTKTLGTDYTFTVNSSGQGVVARVSTGSILAGAAITVDYDYLTPSTVDAADIIGGVDAATQKKTGLELVGEVFPRFQKVPGQILAPGFSSDPTVAAVMTAKASAINGNFKAMVLTDIPTGTVAVYTGAAAWKSTNSYTDKNMEACWPMGRLGGVLYNMSTLMAARCMTTDANNGGIPYESPSNKTLPIDGIALADGTEVVLDEVAANTLNDAGIVTAINSSGWRAWGNRTAAYPGSTDPADTFIPLARMRVWNTAVIILSHKQRVDNPMNLRQIEAVVDSENIRLNSLTASGALLGGRVEFRKEKNTIESMTNGQAVYTFLWAPPTPMQGITFQVEYDVTYSATLFG
jgi:phage tail sheath protein FI